MIRPNSVRAPLRTNVKSLRVLSCMSCCLFRNEAPSQEENQKTGSENRRRNTGWSIGLNISGTSVCNRAESTTRGDEVRPSAQYGNRPCSGSPGALLRQLLVALLVVLANVLSLFGREGFQPLVVVAFLHRGGHAGQQVLRLWQEVAVENPGDFIEAVPLHVVGPVHRGAQRARRGRGGSCGGCHGLRQVPRQRRQSGWQRQ